MNHAQDALPPAQTAPGRPSPRHLAARDVLLLSAWCGLAAGLGEVATRVTCRAIDPTQRLYLMTRHFVWLGPLANLALFVALGSILALFTRFWPRVGRWLSPRLLGALLILPSLMVAVPQVYPEAWFLVALGVSTQAVNWLERHATYLRRRLAWSVPVLVAMVAILALSVFGRDWLKQTRESRRPMPANHPPNVLFVVLDTVRADRLSLYGYLRPTTPNLERLATRGIRFDHARATAPWTLPSHASFFTGRWPHELDVQWVTPLPRRYTTLAEFLGDHGFATAGFVANAGYCSYDTGIDRGFTRYDDYLLERLGPLRTAILIDSAVKTIAELSQAAGWQIARDARTFVSDQFFSAERKSAATINTDFLTWFDRRPEPGRPFFVFLNYLDTHTPYLLPPTARSRFASKNPPPDSLQVLLRWSFVDKLKLPQVYLDLASNAYDDCLAYLDEQLGVLIDRLDRRGALEHTWIVIVSDHGEGLGEHGLFMHGESLYRPEVGAVLLVVPPSGTPQRAVVPETVSLRDLPATIVDLVGLGKDAPFPGRSLARLWRDRATGAPALDVEAALSELAGPNPLDPNQGRSPSHRGPLISLADGPYVLIRNERDGHEELYDHRTDPREWNDLAPAAASKPILDRLRAEADRLRRPR